MQILLASAKIMHDALSTAPDVELSSPRFAHEAEAFARDMAQYSAGTIAEMLSCSRQIAEQNKLRFMRFFEGAGLPEGRTHVNTRSVFRAAFYVQKSVPEHDRGIYDQKRVKRAHFQ